MVSGEAPAAESRGQRNAAGHTGGNMVSLLFSVYSPNACDLLEDDDGYSTIVEKPTPRNLDREVPAI